MSSSYPLVASSRFYSDICEQPKGLNFPKQTLDPLCDLLSIRSHSNDGPKQEEVMQYVLNTLNKKGIVYTARRDPSANLYIEKGSAAIKVLVIAHVDINQTMRGVKAEDIECIISGQWMFGWHKTKSIQIGLGMDDKVGVAFALRCLLELDNVKVLLVTNEEVGCIGSNAIVEGKEGYHLDFFRNLSFACQLDRRGFEDFITYTNGVDITNKEFDKAVLAIISKPWGYKIANGSSTDVGAMKANGVIKVCAFNFSCGYHNEHSKDESLDVVAYWFAQTAALTLIRRLGTKVWPHICEKKVYSYTRPYSPAIRDYSSNYSTSSYQADWANPSVIPPYERPLLAYRKALLELFDKKPLDEALEEGLNALFDKFSTVQWMTLKRVRNDYKDLSIATTIGRYRKFITLWEAELKLTLDSEEIEDLGAIQATSGDTGMQLETRTRASAALERRMEAFDLDGLDAQMLILLEDTLDVNTHSKEISNAQMLQGLNNDELKVVLHELSLDSRMGKRVIEIINKLLGNVEGVAKLEVAMSEYLKDNLQQKDVKTDGIVRYHMRILPALTRLGTQLRNPALFFVNCNITSIMTVEDVTEEIILEKVILLASSAVKWLKAANLDYLIKPEVVAKMEAIDESNTMTQEEEYWIDSRAEQLFGAILEKYVYLYTPLKALA